MPCSTETRIKFCSLDWQLDRDARLCVMDLKKSIMQYFNSLHVVLCLYGATGYMKMTQLCDMESSYFLIP